MGKTSYVLLLAVAFVVGLAFACYYHEPVSSDGTVHVPVALYFPDEETMEIYEESYIENIEEAGRQFEWISFYVVGVGVREYDLEFIYEDTNKDQFFDSGVVSIYAVLEVSDSKGSYGGVALIRDYCERFTAVVYPIEHPLIMSHELGHLMGLTHVDGDETNIMHPNDITTDATFTVLQRQLAHQQAGVYTFSCPL